MILINLGGTMNTMKYQVVEAREDGSVDEEVREGGSNGNAQQLGDKPFFKERRRVDHLGLGPACVVALGWIRGAASNGEKASKNIQQNRTAMACSHPLPFFLLFAPLLFFSSPDSSSKFM
jgi:hypothetical protein